MRKFQRVEGPAAQDTFIEETPTEEIEEEKLDVNCLDVVLDRIAGGLIGTLRIEDGMNKPLIRVGDLAHIRTPQRLEKKDLVLYKSHEEYFIRRIIKFKEYNIYVAGDHEKEYHIVHKEDIIGKVIGIQRGRRFISLTLNPSKKIYTFRKVNLAYFRLKDRVLDYEDDLNNQALEAAMQNLDASQTQQVEEYKYDFDLDSELSAFLDPDELVRQLENADAQPVAEQEIQYVDEDGNPIDPNEIQEGDEVVDYVEVEEAPEEEEQLLDDDASIEEFDDEAIKAKKAIEATYEETPEEEVIPAAAYEEDVLPEEAEDTKTEEEKK